MRIVKVVKKINFLCVNTGKCIDYKCGVHIISREKKAIFLRNYWRFEILKTCGRKRSTNKLLSCGV